MSEPTTITLGKNDAAWIIREDGSEEVILPSGGSEDDPVPPHVMKLVAGVCSVHTDEENLDAPQNPTTEGREP